ncbi:MAG: hypothetical protein QOG23_3924 [Blastocatellia bacterium]|nr:hypothetical protein [Blastocatellia bacterium]
MKNLFRMGLLARLILVACIASVSLLLESHVKGQTPNIALKGSFTTSETDGVDVFSGELEQILPLITLGGRGEIKQGLYLPLRNTQWRVMELFSSTNNDRTYQYYKADQTNYVNNYPRAGYSTLGKLEVETKFTGSYFMETPSVTEIRFTSNSGSIITFRDVLTNGQPYDSRSRGCVLSAYQQPPSPPPACSRGRVFRAIDGSNALFVADADVYDMIWYDFFGNLSSGIRNNIAGTLFLSNGTRIRVENNFNNITRITDRNGNYMSFEYVTEAGYTQYFLKRVTDSLNREVTIVYGDTTQPSYFDEIVYKGFGETELRLRINYTKIENVMAPGEALGVPLFPGVTNRCYIISSGAPCDPTPAGPSGPYYATSTVVPSSIVLPNGREYQFYYNRYLELVRIKDPTGSYTDYSYSGMIEAAADGFTAPSFGGGGEIYRRVSSVKKFDEAGQLVNEKSFSNIPQFVAQTNPSFPIVDNVTIDVKDGGGTVLSRTREYFYDTVSTRTMYAFVPASYGKQHKTEILDPGSQSVLRRTEITWEQREPFPWCPNGYAFNSIYLCDNTTSPLSAPAVDPRISEIKTTLETGQVTKKTFSYDQYNNVTDTYEYDYGNNQAGSLLRRSHTDYVTDPNYTSYPATYLLRLASQRWVSSDLNGSNKISLTQLEYDNYNPDTNHASLVPRGNVSGFDTDFGASFTRRGNPTAETRFAHAQDQSDPITAYSQYDVVGNLVKSIDAKGFVTTFDYADRFGSPNAEARASWDTVSMPAELNGKSTFAFATSATNALGHTNFSQYDYSTGSVVDMEDANQSVTTFFYNDSLGRLTQMITANNRPDQRNQKSVYFDDANRFVRIRSDLFNYGDNLVKSEGFYNSLGQMNETRTYEPGGYVVVRSEYDALGRNVRTSNPFRPWRMESPIWTTTGYDALSRAISVTTPDNAVVTTSYNGNELTVTDPTGKQRKGVTDALRRLIQVYEDPGGSNFATSYSYDALSDLTTVNQGAQTRTFLYDSLRRLTSAAQPESGTTNYQYDSNGNTLVRTDARGVSTHYDYDPLNRTQRRWFNGSNSPSAAIHNSPALPAGVGVGDEVKYFYDSQDLPSSAPAFDRGYATGRLVGLTYGAAGAGTYFGYDALGRSLLSIQRIDGLNYQVSASYNLAGAISSETYPSDHVVIYNYDQAGRLADKDAQNLAFTGNLGDGTQRIYSAGMSYTSAGQISQEQFGTTTPVYSKLFYNSRQQLSEILASTVGGDASWNRGKIVNDYSNQCSGALCSGTDNNASLKKQSVFIPNDDQNTSSTSRFQQYGYDNLDRLTQVHEYTSNPALDWQQTYTYDRYGNRLIDTDPSHTLGGVNNLGFEIEPTTNRLYSPGDLASPEGSRRMQYDAAGNMKADTYTGQGARIYDPENRVISAASFGSLPAVYTYDGDGLRVKRNVDGIETWQIYGIGGELVAEYAAGAGPLSPQREYGYRNGELLVTATITTGWGSLPALHDNPLNPNYSGETTVQARHITELRDAINALRVHMGMSPYSWQYSATTQDWVTADPILEMRVALNQALGAPPAPGYAAGLAQGFPIRAVHIQELRNRVLAQWNNGPGTVEFRWLVTDQLGTARMIFDESGSLATVSRHDYLPFGEELLAPIGARSSGQGYMGDSIRQKFTGYEADTETGLNFAQARYQSSLQGRFISPDPVAGVGADPQSLNAYSYVTNNPLNSVDPSGLFGSWFDAFDVEIGSLSGFYIDGLAAQQSAALGLLSSGGGIQGPFNTRQYDYSMHTFRNFTAIEGPGGTATGWIPSQFHYLGEFSWGWTNYDPLELKGGDPMSYTGSFRYRDPGDFFRYRGGLVTVEAGAYRDAYGYAVHYLTQSVETDWDAQLAIGGGLNAVRGGLRALIELAASQFAKETAVDAALDSAVDFLGPGSRTITNKAGDKIFLSKDGLRRIRADFIRPSPHANPHLHVEEFVNGAWRGERIWPKDVVPK